MKDLTPSHLRCYTGSCPSVHELDDGRLLIVGASAHDLAGHEDDLLNKAYGTLIAGDKIGDNETAIIISPDLLGDYLLRCQANLGAKGEPSSQPSAAPQSDCTGDAEGHLITINSVMGQMARCAVEQHPFFTPRGLFAVTASLHKAAQAWEDGTPSLRMRRFANFWELATWVEKACEEHCLDTITEWNTPRSGHKAEILFSSRFYSPDKEDDFIDLTALFRNVALGAWREAEEIDGRRERPMVGFLSTLTEEQKAAVLAYDGPEVLGPAESTSREAEGGEKAYATCDEWLGEIEGYATRSERLPEGALIWVQTAWDLATKAALAQSQIEEQAAPPRRDEVDPESASASLTQNTAPETSGDARTAVEEG